MFSNCILSNNIILTIMDFKIYDTSRGNQNGYSYRIDAVLKSGDIYLRCTNKKCKGRLRTDSANKELWLNLNIITLVLIARYNQSIYLKNTCKSNKFPRFLNAHLILFLPGISKNLRIRYIDPRIRKLPLGIILRFYHFVILMV